MEPIPDSGPSSSAATKVEMDTAINAYRDDLTNVLHPAPNVPRSNGTYTPEQRMLELLQLQRFQLARDQALYRTKSSDSSGADAADQPSEEAAILSDSIWKVKIIPVYWDVNATIYSRYRTEREWVRNALQKTWETVCGIRFVGWVRAPDRPTRGIRIAIRDENPRCLGLGRHVEMSDATPGMILNFDFNTWCPQCRNNPEIHIRRIAVHEFGHAMGFAHEHNRRTVHAGKRSARDPIPTVSSPFMIQTRCELLQRIVGAQIIEIR
ncbi:MAG: hypothetical protein U0992_22585 [Planctomycetaceae bacterium]